MGVPIVLSLRIAQGVMALLVLALSSYVANWYNMETLTSSPSQVNFLIFAAVWSALSLVGLEVAPKFSAKASHPYAILAFEVTNVLFWFAGFVAQAVFLGSLLFCRGSVCAAAQADTVFAAFSFLIWGTSVFFAAKDVFKGGFRKPAAAAAGGVAGPAPMKETVA